MTSKRASSSELWILLIARLTFDLDFQSIILFFSVFNESFQIETWFMGFLITIYAFFMLLSPIFGNLSDQYGRRGFIILGLMTFTLASVTIVLAQNWVHILIARALSGLGNAIFFPALLAELGDKHSYEKRARAMGLVRLSWPITFIFGVPMVGYSIEFLNWQLPFIAMAIIAFLTGFVILLNSSTKVQKKDLNPTSSLKIDLFKRVLFDRYAISGLFMMFLASVAIEGLISYFPTWLENDFQLGESSVSIIYACMGIGTLFGTLLTTWIGDKLGSKQCAVIGLGLASLCMILLANLSFNPSYVILWVLVLGFTFDFSMTAIPVLLTQLASDAKGTVMSLNQTMTASGTAIGAGLSGIIWFYFNYSIIGLFFGIIAIIGTLIGFFFIQIVPNIVPERTSTDKTIEKV